MPDTVLKSICSENFLQINTEASVVKLIFREAPCFQHIHMNNFRRMRRKYEHFSLRGILFQIFKQHSCYKGFIAKTFDGNMLKDHKSYLDNKKQKAMFLVVS